MPPSRHFFLITKHHHSHVQTPISRVKIEFTLSDSSDFDNVLENGSTNDFIWFSSSLSFQSSFCVIKPIGLSRVFSLSLGPPAAVLWLVRSDKLDCRRVRMKMARKFRTENFSVVNELKISVLAGCRCEKSFVDSSPWGNEFMPVAKTW